MKNQVTKSARIAFKDLGIKSPVSQSMSPKYYEKMEETRARWAKEDAEKAKNK